MVASQPQKCNNRSIKSVSKKLWNAVFKRSIACIQRITGIEPASPAWEAGVLPMNYIRMKSV